MEKVTNFLVDLLKTKSPSGHAERAIEYVKNAFEKLDVKCDVTVKGALICFIKGKNGSIKRTVSAHVDTLAAMIKEIKGDGSITLSRIGGYTMNSVEGEYCTVETFDGKFYTGTILYNETSVHVYDKVGTTDRTDKNMVVRLDEIVKNDKDVKNLGISVGNYVHFDPRVFVNESGFVKSRHLDDKAGVAVLYLALLKLKDNGMIPEYDTYYFISNNEEVGHGARAGYPGDTAEFLAVDMGAVGKGQASKEDNVAICIKDSSGPYNYDLTMRLKDIAVKNKINYAMDIFPHYGSDASAAISAGLNAKHALIGPGIDASHAMERTHVKGIEESAKLLYHYIVGD